MNKSKQVDEYISSLPEDRKEAIHKLRGIFIKHLPKGFEEDFQYNMIAYVVPHSAYPNGYHVDPKKPLPFINIASQKNHIAIYHMGIYSNPELLSWFEDEYKKQASTKLDMGKSCLRFKKVGSIPYKLIEELAKKVSVKDWISIYESNLKN